MDIRFIFLILVGYCLFPDREVKLRLAKYAAVLLILALPILAQIIDVRLDFPSEDFRIENGLYTKIYHNDGFPSGIPGNPQYVIVSKHILLPPGKTVSSVEIQDAVWEPLADGTPFPAQPPAVLSVGDPGLYPPDPSVYSRDAWFPQTPLISHSSGNLSGYSLAGICLAPIRWNPVDGIAERLASCRLIAEYSSAQEPPIAPARRSQHGADFWDRAVGEIVVNPELKTLYSIEIDPDAYDWAILIPDSPFIELLELLKLRRSYGLRDTVVELTDVYSIFPGDDDAEKMRNAIADLYIEYGITYAVILGDPLITPDRTVFAFDCEAGFYDDENQIRSDLYFSDLDGSWNADGDTVWGEIEDSVDMYPEVLVGRYSLFPASDLEGYIQKLLYYEMFPSEDFAHRGLMLGQVLWDDPYTDGGEFKDDLIDNVFPDDFTFGRVYSRDGGNAEMGLDSLDTGPNLINHAGHASSSVLCLDHGSCIWLAEMEELRNETRPSILFSIGCWPAATDKDCIAERYLNNPIGGGTAFIGNSRYGWGSPGNSGFGYSEILDRAFWRKVFNGYPSLGQALAMTKIDYIPYARWENVWRWVVMELNLLGDPATEAIVGWNEIEIDYVIEGDNIGVWATDGLVPAESISTSLFDDDGLIDRAITNSSGFASLDISGTTAPIYISSREKGLDFTSDTITTLGPGFFRYFYADEYGYTDGTADPGDTIKVVFDFGGFDFYASGISWDPTSNVGAPLLQSPTPADLAVGDSTRIWANFVIPADLTSDEELTIVPDIRHTSGEIGFSVSLKLNIADYNVLGAVLVDDDSSLATGETAQMWIYILNVGDGTKGAGILDLSCPGGELNVSGSPSFIPLVSPRDTALVGPFDIEWAVGEDAIPVVELMATIRDIEHRFYLSTRQLGFTHDAETGESPFFTTSMESYWHRVDTRAYSGSRSWWCGSDVDGRYIADMSDTLYSELFVIGGDAELSFHAYMSFPNYGSDGVSVEVLGSEDTVRLDYLGSGGALLSFIVGWAEYRYEFDGTPFEPGDTIRLRFRFDSDSEDEEEGVFIDDIELCCNSTEFTIAVRESPDKPDKVSLDVYPNPFNASLKIELTGNFSTDARLGIFNIDGRLVRELQMDNRHFIIWDGNDKVGAPLPSGLYFVRLIENEKVFTARAVLLK